MTLLPYCWIFVISTFYNAYCQDVNCGDDSLCEGESFNCTGSDDCIINCNAPNSCDGTIVRCHDDQPHSVCQINCYGDQSCKNMDVTSYRDTAVNCIGWDSCNSMKIHIYGNNPNDKINAIIIPSGWLIDNVTMQCYNDGIGECLVQCRGNGSIYSCMDVDLDCYTKGTCRYHCDANACCGCGVEGLHENNLRCYEGDGHGNNNCIKEDDASGGCEKAYGCIRKDVFPTPSSQPTKTPTKYILVATIDATVDTTIDTTVDATVDATYCVSMTIAITDLIGVMSSAFITDINLQNFVMNSTKFVIYQEITDSFVYDTRTLCDDFWNCFHLTLLSIHGNTILSVNVCCFKLSVYEALFDKISDSVDEMAAYITSQLMLYLNGSDNHDYNDANTDNMIISVEMEIDTTTETNETSNNTIVIIVVLMIAVMFIIFTSIAFYKKTKGKKIKIRRLPTRSKSVIEIESIPAPHLQEKKGDEGMNMKVTGGGNIGDGRPFTGSLKINHEKNDVVIIENYMDNDITDYSDVAIEAVNETPIGGNHQNEDDGEGNNMHIIDTRRVTLN